MELQIQNFKCYSSPANLGNFKFNPGLLLIKGDSGIGKSTIFTAISWVLFGWPKQVIPYDRTDKVRKEDRTDKVRKEDRTDKAWNDKDKDEKKSDRTYVCLKLAEGLTIERWKRPELLKVTLLRGHQEIQEQEGKGEKELIDDPAQSLINRRFGPLNVWKACCHLAQNERNTLLGLSVSERFDLLGYLAFGEDESLLDSYYTKLDNKISDLGTLWKNKTLELEFLEKKLPRDPEDGNENGSLSPGKLDLKIRELKRLLSDLQAKDRKNSEHLIRKGILEQQLQATSKSLQALAVPGTSDIEGIDSMINQLKSKLRYRDSVERINMYQLQLPKTLDLQGHEVSEIPKGFTERDLQQVQNQEQRYNDYITLCHKYQLKPNDLNQEISNLKKFHDLQDLILLKSKIAILKAERSNMTDLMSENVSLEEIRTKIKDLKNSEFEAQRALDVLTCPKCQVYLRYQGRGLMVANDKPVDPTLLIKYQSEISKLGQLESKLLRQQKLDEELSKLQNQIQQCQRQKEKEDRKEDGIPEMTEAELKQKLARFTAVSMIRQVDPPEFRSEEIRLILTRQKEQESQRNLINLIRDLKTTVPSEFLTVSLKDWQAMADELQKLTQKKNQILLEMERKKILYESQLKIQSELAALMPLLLSTEEIQSQIKHLESEIPTLEKRKLYLTELSVVDKLRIEVNQVQDQITGYTKLRQIVSDVEHETLTGLISKVNYHLGDICSELFEDPISVRLELFKVGKTTGRSRPNVHLKIMYHGAEIDNLGNLSGGEGDRLSLALTLALNKVSGTGFLLLDETLSSLNSSVKDACCSVMRKIMTSGVVLNILHDTVEGIFDHVIRL